MRIQREGAQLQIRGTWSAGPGDDQARFLADLRALRDSAVIGYDELAVRAHYPTDVLKEAENGPSLPGLPILTAYVRACEGDVLDWEERWRRLNPDVADDPGLPVRPAGASAAAVAGARAGVSVAPPDVYDPERIKAALRGDQARSEQSADSPAIVAPARDADRLDQDQCGDSGASIGKGAGWGAGSGRHTAGEQDSAAANGNHSADRVGRGPFEAAFSGTSDPAQRTEPAPAEGFSWLTKSMPEPPPGGEPTWREQPQGGFSWSEPADAGLTAAAAAEPAAPEPAVPDQPARLAADGLAAQERTDFWSNPIASVSSSVPPDLQRPSSAGEPTTARRSWSVPADTATEPARRPAAEAAGTAAGVAGFSLASGVSGSTQLRSPAAPAAPTAVTNRDDRRKDQVFPVRLLVVILIAALIGSVLVLLLK